MGAWKGSCANCLAHPGELVSETELNFRFCFAQASDTITGFPLTALFKQFDALKSFENIALGAQSARATETGML
jgi:hypothetical protein